MNPNLIRTIGACGTLLSIAGTLVSGFASEKQLDNMVAKKVAEAIAELNK